MTLMTHFRAGSVESLSQTTSMRVADELRELILKGELKPNQHLKINDLASMLHISPMPVRAALQTLESEGILATFPHKGTMVRSVDAEFIHNMYDIRSAIEGMLSERCAEKISKEQGIFLEKSVVEYESAASAGDIQKCIDANFKLHGIINDVAQNPDALRLLNQGRLLIESLRYKFGIKQTRLTGIVIEHRELLKAILEHNALKAGQIARKHCLSARDDILLLMQDKS